jgi:membrane protease YdiL (CAAX protease family)
MRSKSLKDRFSDIDQFFRGNRREIIVFLTAFFVLITNKYLAETDNLITLLDTLGLENLKTKAESLFYQSSSSRFNSLIYWVSILDLNYIIIPLLVIKLILKEKASEFGLSLKLERNFFQFYFIFMIFMLVFVYFASKTSSFQSKYPFLKIYNSSQLDSKFLMWELVYCSQFFCLEFFFRGFMVKGLQNKFGLWSIFIMTIPYCMIHFGKPLPETIGSVFAGLILGYISYRGKGILAGFLMHITVALAMDFMALWQTGMLGS